MTPSVLDPTGNDAAEREAIADTERPGTWYGDEGADGRLLTQEQTDILIRAQLRQRLAGNGDGITVNDEVNGILGVRRLVKLPRLDPHFGPQQYSRATRQRGGIDSDPLVRLLAFRAWGDRDRRWFHERGVRKGEPVAVTRPASLQEPAHVALAWPDEYTEGVATEAAWPGQLVYTDERGRRGGWRVSDRPREPPRPSG